ncbi:hypothetical protein C8R46DRAFT_1319714 [Mycena filopes]|nr:hypothetical protein C8R46DRAFT_1319714 [Mycena filopes]
MSSNPAHYNVNDVLRFENYADALRAYGARQGPFPGPTPPGYREFFRVRHRYAPIPEDFPEISASQQHQLGQAAPAAAQDVMMSASGLRVMLESQQKMFDTALAANQKQTSVAPFRGRPERRQPYHYRGFFRGGRGNRGQIGRNLVDRLDGPSNGDKRKRSHYNRPHSVVDSVSDVASDVATAGGLTDNEEDVEVISAEDIPEDGELFDQDVDTGFNMAN